MTDNSPQQVVFIDSRVPDIQDLLAGLQPGEVAFVIDPTSDGIQQIANILAANNFANLSSISIVSHGASGELELGSSFVTDGNLAANSNALAEIGAALAPGGAIQLYGCDVAQGASGQQFINDFSTYAGGVQVDAATHIVGSAALGGSWTLDAASTSSVSLAPTPDLSAGAPVLIGSGTPPTAPTTLSAGAPAMTTSPSTPPTSLALSAAPFTATALANFQGDLPTAVETAVFFTSAGNPSIDDADNLNGSDVASNKQTDYLSNPALSHPSDIVLDTQDNLYFIVDSAGPGTKNVIESAPLSQLVADNAPTFSTLYSMADAGPGGGILSLALDVPDQLVYFIQADSGGATESFQRMSFNGSNRTTLFTQTVNGSGTAGFNNDMALDLQTGNIYVPGTSSSAGFGGTIIGANQILDITGFSPTATSVTVTPLPFSPHDGTLGANNFPTADGLIEGVSVDTVHNVLYFTTSTGIFSYNLDTTLNPSGTYSTIWMQPAQSLLSSTGTIPFSGLDFIQVDPTTNTYYVDDNGKYTAVGVSDNSVYVGSLSGTAQQMTPTRFMSITASTGAVPSPDGIALDNAPTLSITPTNATFTESTAEPPTSNVNPVTVITGANAGDSDNTDVASATVSIGGFFAGDTLSFTNTGNVVGSYNSTTGVLTFTGADTFSHYDTVLDSVKFSAGENPTDFGSDTSRTLTWTVSDGLLNSTAQTATVSVVGINDPPTLSNVPTSATFTEEHGAVTLSSGLAVSDPDDLKLKSATVSITGGAFTGDSDVLAATTTGTAITASYNTSSETLTLTGTDTLAHYQQVLDSVTFNAGENPTNFGSNTTRTITWVANDPSGTANGGADTSTISTTTLTVVNVNDPPTLALGASTASWTEETAATTLSSSVTITDPDSLDLVSATVSITGGAFTGDELLAAGQVSGVTIAGTNITPVFAGNGLVTFTGTDTLAHYQQALELVTFNGGENPTDFASDPTRTLTWTLNDGGGTANGGSQTGTATSTISVTFVNDAPSLSNVATSKTFTEEGGAVTLSSAASVSDPDDINLKSATVQITGGTFANDGDQLAADGISNGTFNNISVFYNSSSETLTLTGTDTLANYQFLLDHVTFNAGENPTNFGSNPTRTVTWVLQDPSGTANGGVDTSAVSTTTLSVINVNDPPTLTSVATIAQFTEEGGAVTLSSAVSVSDPDDLNLVGATVKITGGTFAGDLLSATGTASISVNYNSNNETLTLSGTDTLADYQAVLDTVTFNTGENPTNFGADPTRSVTWVLDDGAGSNNLSTPATTTVSITNVNDPPTLSGIAASVTVIPGQTVALSSNVTVTDPDDLDLASATVKIIGGTFAGDGDVLAGTPVGNITISYNPATETLTLTGSDTLAHYAQVLDTVTFNTTSADPTHGGTDPNRTVSWIANDGSTTFNFSSTVLTNVQLQLGPAVGPAANATWTEEGPSTTLSPSVALSDTNGTVLVSATVALTGADIANGTFTSFGQATNDLLTFSTAGTSITASYNTSTETLTLTGSDTIADYQTVLDTVAFSSGENPANYGSDPTRTVTWTVNDGAASNSVSTATSTLSVVNVNDPPTLTGVPASASFTQGFPPVPLSPGLAAITLTDPDDLDLSSATVKISGGTFAGDGDVLSTDTTGLALTASYDAATESLILTGTDTLADYQHALNFVAFRSTSLNPTDFGADPTRTITWVAVDPSGTAHGGLDTSALSTTTLSITAVNQPPTLSNVATSASFTEEGGAVTLSTAVSVTDPDDLNLTGATVSIVGGTFTGDADVLAATTAGTGIVASYSTSAETLVLSGAATLATYQAVLDSITFNAGENPTDFGSDPTRTVTWVLNDGGLSNNLGTVVTTTISVTNVNDPPTLSNVPNSASVTQNGPPVTMAPAASVSDPDNLKLASATVAVVGGAFANDGDSLTVEGILNGTILNTISVSYNSTTETLTLTGADTLADYQFALDRVAFVTATGSGNPTNFGSNPTRTLTWVLNDGSGSFNTSTPATTTVSITAVNQPPTLFSVVNSANFTEEGGPVTLSNAVLVSDPDDLNLTGATVSIVGGTFTGDADVLAANVGGTNITESYNAAAETLVLSGIDTLAHYQQVLDSVTFNAGENPTDFGSNSTRTITWVATDPSGTANGGHDTSAPITTTVNVTNVNDPPTLSAVATGAHFLEKAGAVTLSSAVMVTDPDNLGLASATVAITTGSFTGDGDVLAASTAGTAITASYNSTSETLTLTGSDTLAHYQQVLDSVTFNSTSLNPTDFGAVTSHQVTWVLNDGSGSSNLSTPATTTVSLTAVNDPPTLANVAASATFTEEGAAVTLSSAVTVTDPDDTLLKSATVSIVGGTFVGDADLLGAIAVGNVTVSYSAASETLTLTGTDTLAHYQQVLDSVTFAAGENPTDFGSNPTRTITWAVQDVGGTANGGLDTSAPVTTTVNVINVNDPPTLSNVAPVANITEEAGPVTLSNAVAVSDPDNLTLKGATVAIVGGAFAGDVLAASTAGTAITASYNSTTETLTLAGFDTLAHYQSVLDSVTFNVGENPTDFGSDPTRLVAWVLNDGGGSNNLSAPVTTTVSVTSVNDPPTLSNVAAVVPFHIGHTITVSPNLTVSDPDSLKLASATVAITGFFVGDGDVLSVNVAGTSITSSYNSTTETLTLTGSDTAADYAKVLDSLTFSSGINPGNSNSHLNPSRTLSWVVNDGAGSNNLSTPALTTITVQPTIKNDFNGDQISDLLFQDIPAPTSSGGRGHGSGDPNAGAPQVWLYNGSSVTAQALLSNPGTAWRIAATGDFNADGNADIVWQNTNGTPMIWTMNGTAVTSTTTLTDPGPSWSLVATGDFLDDGNTDLLFQNTDGTPQVWLMNGTSVASMVTLADPGSSWKAIGTGDFNGDGKSDIVFQNSDGTPMVDFMNGATIASSALLPDPGASWHLVGAGDFNGDGKADLLFQNTDGTPQVWLMNGATVTAAALLADPGAAWKAIGTGDFNGDGKSDILFQNTTTGAPMIFAMNGTTVTSTTTLSSPGVNWHASAG